MGLYREVVARQYRSNPIPQILSILSIHVLIRIPAGAGRTVGGCHPSLLQQVQDERKGSRPYSHLFQPQATPSRQPSW